MFSGVGGETMEAQGLRSIFPLSDVAVMGPLAILAGLPKLVRPVYQAVYTGLKSEPDAVIIIDSPNSPIASPSATTARPPMIPIIDYARRASRPWVRAGRAR